MIETRTKLRAVASVLAGILALVPAVVVAAGPDGGEALLVDRREIIIPARGAELVRIDNLLGRVVVRGRARPGEIHIIAEKRAPSAEALGRLRIHYTAFESGEVTIDARVELGGRERSLPLAGSGVDLVLDVPPDVAVEAKTFGGDLTASGLRAGAKLETTGGRIGISDVRGKVVTRQLRGGQTVVAVEGDIDLDGIEGDMKLRDLGGGRIDAKLVDGSIHAEDVRSALVSLVTTTGQIVLVGMIRPGAHYDLRSYAGDVRVIPAADSAGFELRARSPAPIETATPLRGSRREGDWLRADVVGRRGSGRTRTAVLEVSSVLGRLIIQPRSGAEMR